MVDQPDWVTNNPVDVDIDSLDAFAQRMQGELDSNVRPNSAEVRRRLATPAGAAGGRTFGVDARYEQGVIIGNYHTECETRAADLLRRFEVGMQAIAWAAMGIAADYSSADELNNMDMNKISEYFHPKDKSRSLANQVGLPPESETAYPTDQADVGLIPDGPV